MNRSKDAIVLVFGDISRSPRMLNHTRELLHNGWSVKLMGFDGDLDWELVNHKGLSVEKLASFDIVKPYSAVLRYILLSCALAYSLLLLLLRGRFKPQLMMVQTPPVFPTLIMSALFCSFSGCRLVVDWHNLGYSLIHQRRKHLKSLYRRIELLSGWTCCQCSSWMHICVSDRMRRWLISGIGANPANVHVLYDRPTTRFQFPDEKRRLSVKEEVLKAISVKLPSNNVLVVSSTSWTPDEDFGLVLRALDQLDPLIGGGSYKKITLIITGKGPLRDDFMKSVHGKNFRNIEVVSMWLEPDLYPKMLYICDVGLSVHCSSSGLDLPMKLVDMIGSGLPVLAFDYPCLSEVLSDDSASYRFKNEQDLVSQLKYICSPKCNLTLLREHAKLRKSTMWSDEWAHWYRIL